MMYMICVDLVFVIKVFGMMDYKNVVSYNVFMLGLIQNGVYRVVLNVFKDMLNFYKGVFNLVILVLVLGVCFNVLKFYYGI